MTTDTTDQEHYDRICAALDYVVDDPHWTAQEKAKLLLAREWLYRHVVIAGAQIRIEPEHHNACIIMTDEDDAGG